MHEYIFILGKNRELSIAEIIMYYKHRKWNYEMRMLSRDAMMIESENVPNADFLGGTLKIIEIYDKFDVFDPFLITIPDNFEKSSKKEIFGISVYGKSKSWIMKNISDFKSLQKNLKDILRSEGINSRFINFSFKVNNVSLAKKNVKDIVLFFSGDNVYAGLTKSFSNPLEYKKRDEQKPVTVSTMGIPIRLAKIMLNLAGVKDGTRMIDPFCGTGIIIQEALFNDAEVSGSDIDSNMVKAAKRNVEWLIKEYKIINKNYNIFVADAEKISKYAQNDKYDAIVTEPYFGPALKKISSQKTAKHMVNKTMALYNNVLKQFNMSIVKGGYLCIVVPSYRTKTKNAHMNFRKIFTRYSFEEVNIHEGIEQPFREEKKTLTREIFLLVKK